MPKAVGGKGTRGRNGPWQTGEGGDKTEFPKTEKNISIVSSTMRKKLFQLIYEELETHEDYTHHTHTSWTPRVHLVPSPNFLLPLAVTCTLCLIPQIGTHLPFNFSSVVTGESLTSHQSNPPTMCSRSLVYLFFFKLKHNCNFIYLGMTI